MYMNKMDFIINICSEPRYVNEMGTKMTPIYPLWLHYCSYVYNYKYEDYFYFSFPSLSPS